MNKGKLNLDPMRYEALTTTPPEVVADILQATHVAYEATVSSPAARAKGMKYADAKSAQYCMQTSALIVDQLGGLDKSYQAEVRGCYIMPQGFGHFIAELDLPEVDELIVADATWQQFLPHAPFVPNADSAAWQIRPEVLIGSATEVAQVLTDFGFSEAQANSWSPVVDPSIAGVPYIPRT